MSKANDEWLENLLKEIEKDDQERKERAKIEAKKAKEENKKLKEENKKSKEKPIEIKEQYENTNATVVEKKPKSSNKGFVSILLAAAIGFGIIKLIPSSKYVDEDNIQLDEIIETVNNDYFMKTTTARKENTHVATSLEKTYQLLNYMKVYDKLTDMDIKNVGLCDRTFASKDAVSDDIWDRIDLYESGDLTRKEKKELKDQFEKARYYCENYIEKYGPHICSKALDLAIKSSWFEAFSVEPTYELVESLNVELGDDENGYIYFHNPTSGEEYVEIIDQDSYLYDALVLRDEINNAGLFSKDKKHVKEGIELLSMILESGHAIMNEDGLNQTISKEEAKQYIKK